MTTKELITKRPEVGGLMHWGGCADIEREAGLLETRARRAAQRVGLVALKSRWRAGTFDNMGGFMLIDPSDNTIVDGVVFSLTAYDVIELCRADGQE